MDIIFWLLIIVCGGSVFAAVARITKNHQIRKKGGVASSPIREKRLKNRRR